MHNTLKQLATTLSSEHRLTLLAIVALGTALRIYAAIYGEGLHYFAINDEVSAYHYALALLAGEPQALYLAQPEFGAGQIPGPFWTLLWVLLLKLGGGLDGAIVGMALLNSGVIIVIYHLALRLFLPHYALLSALLFAVGAWPVYYAAGLWNPLPLALLGGLLFINLWDTLSNTQSKRIFWVAVIAALIPQFHMIGIFYIPVVLLLLYLSTTTLNRRALTMGTLVGLALYLPYLVGEYHTGFSNTLAFFNKENPFSWGVFKIITAPLTLLSSAPGEWPGKSTEEFKLLGDTILGSYTILVAFSLITLINALLLLLFLYKRVFQSLRAHHFSPRVTLHHHERIFFIGTLIMVPLLLFSLTGKSYTSRYAILILPLLYLLPALFLVEVTRQSFKKWMSLVLTLSMLFNIYLLLSFFPYQSRAIATSTTFLPSFHKMERIRAILEPHHQLAPIRWSYSAAIEALPEIRRKTVKVLSTYSDIHHQYLSGVDATAPEHHYRVHAAHEMVSNPSRLLYRDQSIIITDETASP